MRPSAGQPISDAYVAAVIGWANEALGIATADRIAWRGERQCIVKLVEAGQVR